MPFNLDYFVIFKYQPVYLMISPPHLFFLTHTLKTFLSVFLSPSFFSLELFLKNNLACSFLKQNHLYNFAIQSINIQFEEVLKHLYIYHSF